MIELIAFILVWGVVFTCGVAAICWLGFMAKSMIDEGDYVLVWGLVAAAVMIAVLLIAMILMLVGILL